VGEEVGEAAHDKPGVGLGGHPPAVEEGPQARVELVWGPVAAAQVQLQVELPVGELGHEVDAGLEVVGGDEAIKERLGQRLAGLVVPGDEVEARALPAPVLHDLRGQLDEVPGDVRAGEAAHLDVAREVVEQVAELMGDGLDLAVGEQRRAAVWGRGEVPGDEPDVGAALPWRAASAVYKVPIHAPPCLLSRGCQSV
jgi:hypothetical protein